MEDYRTRAKVLVLRMCEEIERLGFPGGKESLFPDLALACFETSEDPYSGDTTRQSRWLDQQGTCHGEIKIHGDGSFYGEYDVLKPHPRNPEWFVECVVVWGKDDLIKSEPRLIRALGD